jgi:hypothetical protein
MYAHREGDIGRYEKRLLHSEDEEAVQTN